MTDTNALAKQEEAKVAKAEQKDRADTLRSMLIARKEELAQAAEDALPPDIMIQAVIQEARTKPDLLQCSAASVYAAVMEAAQLRLLPNAKLGEAALVPRHTWNKKTERKEWECDLMPMIGGLRKLALETGKVIKTHGSVCCEGDAFLWNEMDKMVRQHDIGANRGGVFGAYGWLLFADGSRAYEYMDREQLEAARKKAAANSPAWADWPRDMYAKVAERRCIKKHAGYRADSRLARAFMLERYDDDAPETPPTVAVIPGGNTTQRLTSVVSRQNQEASLGAVVQGTDGGDGGRAVIGSGVQVPGPAPTEQPVLGIQHPDAVPPEES